MLIQETTIKDAMEKFSDLVFVHDDLTLEDWGMRLLNELAPYAGAIRAVLYVANEAQTNLAVFASYGLSSSKDAPAEILFGEDVAGQSVVSKQAVFLENIAIHGRYDDSIEIMNGALGLWPLVCAKKTCGLLEFVFPAPVDVATKRFLDKMSRNIAININILAKEKALKDSLSKLKESREAIKMFAEIATEGVCRTKDGKIVDANARFYEMFSLANGEQRGQSIAIAFASKKQPFDTIKDLIESRKAYETICKRGDGSRFPAEVEAKDVFFDDKGFQVLIFRDISERKKIVEELNESRAAEQRNHRYVELFNELGKQSEKVNASINYAKRIQTAVLPSIDLIQDAIKHFFVYYAPKDIISGDFYWYAQSDYKHLLAAVDCTGHGVPGALMTMLGNTLLNGIVREKGETEPAEILALLDKMIVDTLSQKGNSSSMHDGMDIALVCIDYVSRTVDFSGAHIPLLYVRKGELHEIKASRYPIGGDQHPGQKVFNQHRVRFQPNDVFYMFSDGLRDQFGGKEDKKFSSKQLKELLIEISPLPMPLQRESIKNEFLRWKGDTPQTDDVMLLGFKV